MKGNLLQGTARGRMGDIVAKVVHGKQILSKYQPVVTNPNSPKQVMVRNRFRNSISAYKEFNSLMIENNVKILYAPYSGASKNMRNLYIPFLMELQKIIDVGAYKTLPKIVSPLNILSITGNQLQSFIDKTMGLAILGDMLNPGQAFFGSDTDLGLNSKLIGFTSGRGKFYPYGVINQVKDIALTLVDNQDNIGLPRGYGFKTDLKDVGEWQYIYSIQNSGAEDTGVGFGIDDGAYPYDENNNSFAGYMFWLDGYNRPIFAQGFNGTVDKPETP